MALYNINDGVTLAFRLMWRVGLLTKRWALMIFSLSTLETSEETGLRVGLYMSLLTGYTGEFVVPVQNPKYFLSSKK
jgi:hypothetical protein